MTLVVETRARGPYSLALTAMSRDTTRRLIDGLLTAAVRVGDEVEPVQARQRPDGSLVLAARSEEGLERLRVLLALEDDHSEFLRRFARDPLVGEATRRLRGLRQARLDTVAHALLRALCGQLIDSRTARAIEARIVRATCPPLAGTRLYGAPREADLVRLSPAELRKLGLHARRGATLVRLCGSLDLERLHAVPTDVAVARISRERGLGPWSAGVICLEGLGRREHGIVGDLGLVKLLSAMRGRWVDAAETGELLEPYGEWAGLASVYLLKAWGRGLIRVPSHRRLPRAAA
jgi:3-methyladenine DNA glycosylase/8-oxoguanine DNA glycosylase